MMRLYGLILMSNLQSCYMKRIKMFFGYDKYSSVTNMFLELGLPTLDTLLFIFISKSPSRLRH